MRALEVAAVCALAAWLGACSRGTFACSDASQCTDNGVAGVCEPSGYCSFPDGSCATGQQYGKHAPSGLANTCVPPGGSDSQTTAGTETETETGTPSSSSSESGPSTSGSDATSVETSTAGSSSGPGEDETTQGCDTQTCPPGCAATWIRQHGTHLPTIRFDTTSNVLVMGSDESEGTVARMSACNGETIASATLPGAGFDYVRPMHAEADDDVWVVVGNRVYENQSARDAFVVHLGLEDLAPLPLETLPSPMEEAWSVGLFGDSRWIVGVSSFTSGMQEPFMSHINASGDACGFGVAPDGAGFTRALAVYGPDIYVGGALSSQAYVARFDTQACSADPCSCTPDWSMEFSVDPQYNEIRGLVVLDGTLYAGGYSTASDNGDYQGFVARIEPPGTEVVQLWTHDPTPLFDAVLELSVEGNTLFVPMTTGYDLPGQDSSGAVGTVVALPLDLEQPESWIAQVPQTSSVLDVVADDEAVYLAARQHEATAYVVKCTRDGACPQ